MAFIGPIIDVAVGVAAIGVVASFACPQCNRKFHSHHAYLTHLQSHKRKR